jgi:hypothetical protein
MSPTAMRMRRLESAHMPHDVQKELRVEIEILCDLIVEDLDKIRLRYDEVEATIALDFDQYGLSRLVYERAMDLKGFLTLYRSKMLAHEYVEPLSDETAIHCVNLAYKMKLCQLENEPPIDDTVFYAWRGHLELS